MCSSCALVLLLWAPCPIHPPQTLLPQLAWLVRLVSARSFMSTGGCRSPSVPVNAAWPLASAQTLSPAQRCCSSMTRSVTALPAFLLPAAPCACSSLWPSASICPRLPLAGLWLCPSFDLSQVDQSETKELFSSAGSSRAVTWQRYQTSIILLQAEELSVWCLNWLFQHIKNSLVKTQPDARWHQKQPFLIFLSRSAENYIMWWCLCSYFFSFPTLTIRYKRPLRSRALPPLKHSGFLGEKEEFDFQTLWPWHHHFPSITKGRSWQLYTSVACVAQSIFTHFPVLLFSRFPDVISCFVQVLYHSAVFSVYFT